MRVAICTDIHGNRHAFEAVIAAAEADGAEELWCLGDLVGYGAEPDACVALAERHCAICLAGNHDLAVVEVLSLEEFSRGAAIAAQWTQDTISQQTREFLLSLQPKGEGLGIGLFHASPRDPVWEYVLSGLTAELCFDATDFRVSLIGHSHVALSFHRPEGQPASGTTRREGTELNLSTGEWLVNPGSTGQPRDGDPRAAWLLLDTDAKTAVYRRSEYDIAGAQAAIRAARLPDSLAERLQYGQ
ncbi:metallophosphoesterase family protein [Candidatus Solirubrobacter pratensis]|uniref:metallophosphoesterase family protein n=1 Tax=Candidatus Solirubrobacter pratensis TaxID=1298857 RepID=UPI0003F8D9DF|nr:metallophosphoesterase family protein [Candidatus Solirubrobacter pratensis]